MIMQHSEELKSRALDLLKSGASARRVAEELGVSNSTISLWKKEAGSSPANGKPANGHASERERIEAEVAELLGLKAANVGQQQAAEKKLAAFTPEEEDRLRLAKLKRDVEAAAQLAELSQLRQKLEELRADHRALSRQERLLEGELQSIEADERQAAQRERAKKRLESAAKIDQAVDLLVTALSDHFSLCREIYANEADPRGTRSGRLLLGKESVGHYLRCRLAPLFPAGDFGELSELRRVFGRPLAQIESETLRRYLDQEAES
jgi:transposase